jgi:hypothetical protein
LTPSSVIATSSLSVWWKCPRGDDHEWEARIERRIRSPNCPFCLGRRVSDTNSLATLYPDVARWWHPTMNRGLLPSDVLATTKLRVWWRCGRRHVWQSRVCDRTVARGYCPMCARG